MDGKIVALIIREELVVNYGGREHSLLSEGTEDMFKGLKLSREELSEIKKLPSNIRENLMAKFFLKGTIKSIVPNKQVEFIL